jgi:hypothetical protein
VHWPASSAAGRNARSSEGVSDDRDLDDDLEDEVVYELDDWDPQLRTLLSRALEREGIPHLWEEDGELVVRAEHSDRVDDILDEVEYPEALEATDDAGGDDEASYKVLSDLFVAADRLMHAPADARAGDDFVAVTERVDASDVPFGISPERWDEIRELAAALRRALGENADDDVVSHDAGALRHRLREYV